MTTLIQSADPRAPTAATRPPLRRSRATLPAILALFGLGACDSSRSADLSGLQAGASSRPPPPHGALLKTKTWLNTRDLRPKSLRGKVVLVNFWTYSCINSLRALPYLKAWAAKYKADGLVVVGVHAPEFAFEKDPANVRTATAALGVGYPVALDNDYKIWSAFRNQAWPSFYFIGADGQVRRQIFGEGNYAQSERLLQDLLTEANGKPVVRSIAQVDGKGAEAAADEKNIGSPETYIGLAQATRFASPGGALPNLGKAYRQPAALTLNHWSLDGVWTIGDEFATQTGRAGRIAYRFHARDLHLVMAPSVPGHPVRFTIRIDHAEPGADHGIDVDPAGRGVVRDARMYQLVRQHRQVADRTFEIEFQYPGIRAYAFTFG